MIRGNERFEHAVGESRSQKWELRLGPLQSIIVIGALLGSLFGAFYLGFFSGRGAGFETARASSQVDVAKMPVFDQEQGEAAVNQSEVYSELEDVARVPKTEVLPTPTIGKGFTPSSNHQAAVKETPQEFKKEDTFGSDLGKKKATKTLGEFEDTGDSEGDESLSDPIVTEDESLPSPSSRVLGQSDKDHDRESGGKGKTLGDIIDERVEENRATTPKVPVGTPSKSALTMAVTVAPLKVQPTTATTLAMATPTVRATPVETRKPDTQEFVKQVLPSGWFAQISAPKKLSEAQEAARKLKKSGFAVVIENANVRGENYYRIIVGPEDSRVQAERLVEQLVREKVVAGKPFVRRVR